MTTTILAHPAAVASETEEPSLLELEITTVNSDCFPETGVHVPSTLIDAEFKDVFEVPETFLIDVDVEASGLTDEDILKAGLISDLPLTTDFQVEVRVTRPFAGVPYTITLQAFEDLNGDGEPQADELRSTAASTSNRFNLCNEIEIGDVSASCDTDADGDLVLTATGSGRVTRPVPVPNTYRIRLVLFPGTNADPEPLPDGAILSQRIELDRDSGEFTYEFVVDSELAGRRMTLSDSIFDDANGNGEIDADEQPTFAQDPEVFEDFTFPDCKPPATTMPVTTTPSAPSTGAKAAPSGQLPFTGANSLPLLIGGLLLSAVGATMLIATRRRQPQR